MKKRKLLMMKCVNCGEIFWWDAAFYGAQCPKCYDPHPFYVGVSRLTPLAPDRAGSEHGDDSGDTRAAGEASR